MHLTLQVPVPVRAADGEFYQCGVCLQAYIHRAAACKLCLHAFYSEVYASAASACRYIYICIGLQLVI